MEHQRIDEGTKRPKNPQPPAPRPLEGNSWSVPDGLDPDKIISEYLVEQQTSGIAKRYGIRRGALTRWLAQQRPTEWKEVQRIRAFCPKEDGIEQTYDARTALQLARARELIRSAQFDLQALDEDYRPKQDIRVELIGDLGERLRRSQERTVNAAPALLQRTTEITDVETKSDGVIRASQGSDVV